MTKTKSTSKLLAGLLVLAMLLMLIPITASADTCTTATAAGLTVQFGDSNYPVTEPESGMIFDGSGSTYTVRYTGTYGENNFYPYILAFCITGGKGGITGVSATNLTLKDGNNEELILTGTDANAASYLRTNGFCTIELAQGSGLTRSLALTTSSGTLTLNFNAPRVYVNATQDTTPSGYVGYLPIGQYANGRMWGNPYSDGTAATGTTPKVVGGYSSTGLSLGAAGGYAEYSMVINNYETVGETSVKIQRPYGVDFIVYGNAFVGNPEAGSVKVYGTRKDNGQPGWFELAGSLYYSDITLRDVDVTYKKVESTDNTFTTKGIWYKITKGDTPITDWTKFNQKMSNGVQVDSPVAWWPETNEGYALSSNNDAGLVVDTANNTITYQHITLVKDTDTTSDYGFGYFDVTPNGNSYGTPVNPYVYGTTGGNAYDLDWAVDNDGIPVELSSISKIRVYTSAAMKTDGSKQFTVPAIFGETSAEICGIYAVSAASTDENTHMPSISIDGNPVTAGEDFNVETINDALTVVDASPACLSGQLTITASGATNISINGSTGGTYVKPANVNMVRVIAQTDDGAPYIVLIKF